jgi:uncharacterized membrane protein
VYPENPRATVRIAGRPIYAMIVPIPVVCFLATFVTDVVYWKTAAMMWANMSAWFLTVGLIVSIFAVIAGLIDFFGDRRVRALRAAWVHALGNGMAVILSIVNAFVHSRDAYTSVVPGGLVLSTLVVLILAVTAWNGWGLVYRHGVGVHPKVQP